MIEDKSLKPANRKHRTHRMHPNSLKAIVPTQWPKGVSGNNGGDGYSLKAALKHSLGKPLVKPPDNAPARDHVVYSTIKGAISCEPSSAHLRELWDRVEGPVKDSVHVNFNEIKIVVVEATPPKEEQTSHLQIVDALG